MSDPINDFIAAVEASHNAAQDEPWMSDEHKAYIELVRTRIEQIEGILAADAGLRNAKKAGYEAALDVLIGLLCQRHGYEAIGCEAIGLQGAMGKAIVDFFAAREARRVEAAKTEIDRIAGDTSMRDAWNKLAKALDV